MFTHVCWVWQTLVQHVFNALHGQCFAEWHRVQQVQDTDFALFSLLYLFALSCTEK